MIKILVSEIIAEQDFMIRDLLDKRLVQQYSENIEYILNLSPIVVWDTPNGKYLSDGFHRLAAARSIGLLEVNAILKKGSVEDAYADACLANLKHGKPLSQSERQKAIKGYIKIHPEWSNVKLSDEVGCSDVTILRYRRELEAVSEIEPREKVTLKDGRTRDMNTFSTNVEKGQEPEVEPEPDPFDEWYNQNVICGDALEVLPTLNKQYDLAIIDPPYGITTEKWDLMNKHELLAFTRQWIIKLMPLMKSTGRMFIFWSRKYMFDLKPILDEIETYYPLEFGGMMVWHFGNVGSMPDNQKRYKLAWEPVFYYYGIDAQNLERTSTEISGEKWGAQWDVWNYAIPQSNFNDKRIHPTQKPLDLYKYIIETASKTGDAVLDPFAGSGTTGHAALLTGRNFTLIEQDENYFNLIKKRLEPIWRDGKTE